MPKFYCDYCDVFLTHDSPSVRKTHCQGWKHKASVKQWYQQFEVDIIQEVRPLAHFFRCPKPLIDLKVREYEARMGTRQSHAFALTDKGIRAPPGGMPPGGVPAAAGSRPW